MGAKIVKGPIGAGLRCEIPGCNNLAYWKCGEDSFIGQVGGKTRAARREQMREFYTF